MATERLRMRFNHLGAAENVSLDGLSLQMHTVMMESLATDGLRVREKPRDIALRDWTVYLLHTAAEIEHALMVQYLYAMYSLDDSATPLPANDQNGKLVAGWIRLIRGIAIEEMGHLLTVQNVLRFVGGTLSLARQDYPIPTDVYPFSFQLEPLTKDVLAKYVYAEMPDGEIDETFLTKAERAEIETRAKKAARVQDGQFANHVGTLYATLLEALKNPAFQKPATDGFPHDTEIFQAVKGFGWTGLAGNSSLVIPPGKLSGPRLLSADSIGDVVASIDFVARQGEASDRSSMGLSHFGRFLSIYRAFPEVDAPAWNKSPTLPVATNPATVEHVAGTSPITHPTTQLWARLFDLRYRMLLATIAHTIAIPRVKAAGDASASPATDALVNHVFDLMVNLETMSIAGLAKSLTKMPLEDPAKGTTKGTLAGAPFSMPYSTSIPDRDRERWQSHLDMLDSVAILVAALQQAAVDPHFPEFAAAQSHLQELLQADDQWRTIVKSFMV